ncbi:restriction endonuclease subunit R [Megasphaera sp. DISK 18]|nr:restriction endonuclease subunit R [Megasphaera sp. DISK 18]
MKFKFTIQQYQTDAVNSVVQVFNGQPFQERLSYRRDTGTQAEEDAKKYGDSLFAEADSLGFSNSEIALSQEQLLKNIQAVQTDYNITLSDKLIKPMGACSIDVEMETGTGKTYVYIKTMFELNQRYGWSKFIVVVPSIAIREGVQKSFQTMQDHFMELYGKKARFFVYNSNNLTDIDTFSSSADLSVMIINTQAFNSSFDSKRNKEGRGGDKAARIIFTSRDEFGSRVPMEVIAANRPIIIMDEPQKMSGDKTQKGLKKFNPLFILNYSATHKEQHNLVYVLDALDAYRMKLVKKIEVKGFEVKNLHGTDSYLFLEEIVVSPKDPPKARLEFEISYGRGIKRETRKVGVDDDLYALSKGMEQYKGFHINDINPKEKLITFTNGVEINVGEVLGDVGEKNIRRVQIRETIRSHFKKERELYSRGIKTLSLFFIDKVEHYRKYDEAGNELEAEYAKIFEEEYLMALNEEQSLFDDSPYGQYLKNIDVHNTHAGYFSIDKKGHSIDSKVKKGADVSDDESAYELILKDKERLLSFENPVRFIFSHSALREGWDNPNVFQICTLKHGGDSTTNKRQEVGRGLRLCVNQAGDRMDENVLGSEVHDVNQLTVIASEGYKDYVASLQKSIIEDLRERPTKITMDYFQGKRMHLGSDTFTITKDQAQTIFFYLATNHYINEDGQVTDTYRADMENKTLKPLPDKIQKLSQGVHALVQFAFDKHAVDDMFEDGHVTKIPENRLNDNFYKKEFQTLWNYINHKYSYTVHFDSDELVQNAIRHIDEKLFVSRLRYTITQGGQTDDWSAESLKAGTGFKVRETKNNDLVQSGISQIKYDLIGKIGAGTHLTRRTVVRILKGILPIKFAMYRSNPEEFIAKTIKLINEEKATMIVNDITYNQTDGTYDSEIFTVEKNKDFSKAYRARKSIQDYVFTDGFSEKSVERRFAEDMDADDKVVVYAKLPRGFQIPTPVGNYAPDWAIAFKKDAVKHIYFIAETKGSMDSMDLRPIEQAKIACAKKLFNEISTDEVVYEQVDTYQNLLNIMDAM